MNINKLVVALTIAASTFASGVQGDDTELYVIDVKSGLTGAIAPQVLIIFDNSGSMNDEVPGAKDPYDPSWSDADYTGPINDKAIYWSVGGIDSGSTMPVPDDPNEWRRFELTNNNCKTAALALATKGRFTGYLAEYRKQGGTGSWLSLAENNGLNTNDMLVECQEDTDAVKSGTWTASVANPVAYTDKAYPLNSKEKYTGDVSQAAKLGGLPVTLYSEHYLKWYQWATDPDNVTEPDPDTVFPTRLDLAKNAVKEALADLEGDIDVGMAIFNINHDDEFERDGGRIISKIQPLTSSYRESLVSLVSALPAKTNTPLCETLYEAYLYFAGQAVDFGDNDAKMQGNEEPKSYEPNKPPRDLTAENAGKYISPFKTCPQMGFVIYITDGVPTVDQAANTKIQQLINATGDASNAIYKPYPMKLIDGSNNNSYLPPLAAYMYNNDLVKGVKDGTGNDNQQSTRLITIGFSKGAEAAIPLLKEAALRGGNEKDEGFYYAETPEALVEALTGALKTVLAVNSSFTSPSIASNNFDKTQTFNAAYYAMFLPNAGPRWSGNLKKLKVTSTGELVGPGGETGVISANGSINSDVCTFWNECAANAADGNKVLSGGVLPSLRAKAVKGERIIYTNSGSDLVPLSSIDISTLGSNMGYGNPDGTVDTVEAQKALYWLYGIDVDDDNSNNQRDDARDDIMGDPLHSKPLALNFGSAPTEGKNSAGDVIKVEHNDVRIVIGTNQGLVHMFQDSETDSKDFTSGSVSETWAFIPMELLSNIKRLRDNKPYSGKAYGMDLSPVSYTELNNDGTVEKAYVYLGMRRGGTSYYALDITTPGAPKLLWNLKAEGSFSELAMTWSEPVVTKVKGKDFPVLVIGGGYDEGFTGGNAVYMVNATTGAFVEKYTATGMASIPNKVAVLDSNNDGFTDRIYASDVKGNVWRIDRPESADGASVFKFASLGGSGDADRRFFAEPVVAQTAFTNISTVTDGDNSQISYQNIPYDAVAIGTGRRPNPLDTSTEDMFFVLQDRNIVTKLFTDSAPPTITLDQLYNVTSAAPATEEDNIAFGEKKGWYFDYSVAGEKTLSAALIFDGKVYFTSFIPPGTAATGELEAGVCAIEGQGRLYVLDLHKGTRTYSKLYYELGERVPDTPQIVLPPPEKPGDLPQAYIIGVGKGEQNPDGSYKGTINIGAGLDVNKIYYHVDE
ncbi:type IV pilin biogenesis protein [Shewanella sp. JM162201]|uniref:Type IV pilin biogenesis protein n=1 Tax=Shewanella jiangmenensis TaxID=2837387 RepID=A0ABS5UZ98_9GAMM|nr:PilC/PilY family type IV pilus protein [Shewanella jiangmenensis]MBT1443514.1 type IV pilin biogenesis protein [Shewanella jiangmenensis]